MTLIYLELNFKYIGAYTYDDDVCNNDPDKDNNPTENSWFSDH